MIRPHVGTAAKPAVTASRLAGANSPPWRFRASVAGNRAAPSGDREIGGNRCKTVETFDHDVRDIENEWIPLSDGCRLAARIWRPVDAEDHSVPAILEYIPYRKRDFMRGRDEAMHRYFAGHGYAAVRVDMRGSGESDGLLHDEYLKQEQDDALEVIAWTAAQPWCDGAVGMMGKSWGGFNALQVAARRPPALKAILPVMGTDDRFAEDVHYSGGCC